MHKKRVYLKRVEEYNYGKIRVAIEQIFNNMGGLENFFKPGDRILLKMNLLMKKSPEEGVTTHPIFVKALGDLLQEYGCKVVIGDSPGGPFTKGMLQGVYKACGVTKIAEESGFELNENIESVVRKVEKGKILNEITVMEVIEEVDHIISLSKLKTHGMMKFTGAVKNLFGIIPGLIKAEYHFKMQDVYSFSEMLVDVCHYKEPTLSFMDGIIGMEGDGPSSGDLRRVEAVIASQSPYALDYVACQLVGIEPLEVPTVERTVERGFIAGDGKDIEVLGDPLSSFAMKPFIAPKITDLNFFEGRFPHSLVGPLSRYLLPKPVFDHESCISCGDCVRVCPAKVIHFNNQKPYANLKGCIRCFCCQELCPVKAVKIKRSSLGDWIFKW